MKTKPVYEPPLCEAAAPLRLEQLLCVSPEPGGNEDLVYEDWSDAIG